MLALAIAVQLDSGCNLKALEAWCRLNCYIEPETITEDNMTKVFKPGFDFVRRGSGEWLKVKIRD